MAGGDAATKAAEKFLTEAEEAGVKAIREAMGDGAIPTMLDTDFNLARWWRGNHAKLDELLPKLRLYIANRRALHIDTDDFLERVYDDERVKHVAPMFSISRLGRSVINRDNGIMLIEDGHFDHKQVPRCVTTGEYLEVFFAYCEVMLQNVLRQEAETGRPAHGVCVFDMADVHLSEHVNPTSAANKVFRARATIWQDFYPEMMQRIVIVNPPLLLTVVWTCIRFLLNEQAQKLISVASKHADLLKVLDAHCTPVAFGGRLRDTASGWADRDNCTNTRVQLAAADYYRVDTVWHGADKPPAQHADIHSKKSFDTTLQVTEPDSLLRYQFSVNSEVEFCVWFTPPDGETTLFYPKLKLVTTLVPEEKQLTCAPGAYKLEWINHGGYFSSVKLNYAASVTPANK